MKTSKNRGAVTMVAEPNDSVRTVALRGVTVDLETDVGQAFILDCARNVEGQMPDEQIKRKYELSDANWQALATNTPLLRAVRAECQRRILSGEAAREAAQRHLVKAPGVLNGILNNEQISARHRIEAARELRQAASTGPEVSPGPKEKFVITINLGDQTEVFEKEIVPQAALSSDDGEVP
jgi:hypothetical protein